MSFVAKVVGAHWNVEIRGEAPSAQAQVATSSLHICSEPESTETLGFRPKMPRSERRFGLRRHPDRELGIRRLGAAVAEVLCSQINNNWVVVAAVRLEDVA